MFTGRLLIYYNGFDDKPMVTLSQDTNRNLQVGAAQAVGMLAYYIFSMKPKQPTRFPFNGNH